MKQQWSRWNLGAHTTCCEERPVLLRVPSPAQGALLAGSQCLLSAQASGEPGGVTA